MIYRYTLLYLISELYKFGGRMLVVWIVVLIVTIVF